MSFLFFIFILVNSFSSSEDCLKIYGFVCLSNNDNDNNKKPSVDFTDRFHCFVCVCVHLNIINFCTFLLFLYFHCLSALLVFVFQFL